MTVVALIVGVLFSVIGLFALGPAILFFLALWIMLRGAWGVWALKSGRAITDPLGWWI